MAKRNALFLDRDGIFNEVIIRNGVLHSPRNWDEIKHYSGLDSLSRIKEMGFLLILITNQPDIERGIVSEEFVREVNSFYQNKYALDATEFCPFSANTHPDKKPNPGMFLRATEKWGIDLNSSFHLGDTERDIRAAQNCGATPILWTRDYNQDLKTQWRVNSIDAVIQILGCE